MSCFLKWLEDSVLSVRNGNSEGKALPFEIGEIGQQKKIENLTFSLKVSTKSITMK